MLLLFLKRFYQVSRAKWVSNVTPSFTLNGREIDVYGNYLRIKPLDLACLKWTHQQVKDRSQ